MGVIGPEAPTPVNIGELNNEFEDEFVVAVVVLFGIAGEAVCITLEATDETLRCCGVDGIEEWMWS
jgi:hypothetical protein